MPREDDELDGQRARIAALETAIAERDRTLEALEAAARAESPRARHRALVAELQAELRTARAEADELVRARDAARPGPSRWARPELIAIGVLALVMASCWLLQPTPWR